MTYSYKDIIEEGKRDNQRQSGLVKTVCPKCQGNYWADPMRKCSRCHVGFIWVEETEAK